MVEKILSYILQVSDALGTALFDFAPEENTISKPVCRKDAHIFNI